MAEKQAAYRQLKQDIAAGTPRNLYIFHGEETYLREYYLSELTKKLVPPAFAAFNAHRVEGKGLTVEALTEIVEPLPMMAERTLVQVTDFDIFKAGEKDREEYMRILSNLPDYCCLVLVYDLMEYKPDARTKLAAVLKQHGTAVNFARQEVPELAEWVRRHFRALGKDIDIRLCRQLIELCGDLMQNLDQEIEKIGAYARADRITMADIEAVATPQLSAGVFRIAEAIGEKNYDDAARVLGELYRMQVTPYEIMGAFGAQMRKLYSARLALSQGRGADYVGRLWGMKFPANKLMNTARRFSLPWCRRAVIRCAQTDLAMKSTGQDAKELMTSLLLELAGTA